MAEKKSKETKSKIIKPSSAKATEGKQKSKVITKKVESKTLTGNSKIAIKSVKKPTEKTKKETVETKVEVKEVSRTGKSKGGNPVVKVFDKEGKVVEEMELPKEIFSVKVNPTLMAQAVRVYLANQRMGTAFTKTRGEVTGSTKKIYRQKGTGRARHGAITAPVFVGGGIVFGPRTRDFSLSFPKKMKKKALYSALTSKYINNQVVVIDGISNLKPKTKDFVKVITKLNLVNKDKKADKILFVLPGKIENLEKAARNVEGLKIEKTNLLTTYEVLANKYILFLKESIGLINGVNGGKKE